MDAVQESFFAGPYAPYAKRFLGIDVREQDASRLNSDFGVGVNKMELYDVIIIGGGPGGLSAAYSAYRNGSKKILVIERDRELGGILQ